MHLRSQLASVIAAASSLALCFPSSIDAVAGRPQSLQSFSGENGFYEVITARDGTNSATFTPFGALNIASKERSLGAVERDAEATSELEKRFDWTVFCSPQSLVASDVLAAQAGLRASVGSGQNWAAGHWGFVKYGTVIAYACSYNGDSVTFNLINNYEVFLDSACGWPVAGYLHLTATSFAVGRAAYGGDICASGFIGW